MRIGAAGAKLNGSNGHYCPPPLKDRRSDGNSTPHRGVVDSMQARESIGQRDLVTVPRESLRRTLALLAEYQRGADHVGFWDRAARILREGWKSHFADGNAPQTLVSLFLWSGGIYAAVYGSTFLFLLIDGAVAKLMK